eukprot:1536299-Rhodomonas_salina.1
MNSHHAYRDVPGGTLPGYPGTRYKASQLQRDHNFKAKLAVASLLASFVWGSVCIPDQAPRFWEVRLLALTAN